MFTTPYSTTACAGYSHAVKDILTALQKEYINEQLPQVTTKGGTVLRDIYQVPPYVKGVAPFSHPVQITLSNGRTITVIDARPFTRVDRLNNLSVFGRTEYDFLVMRAMLVHYWVRNGSDDQKDFGLLAAEVFQRMVAEAITTRYALEPIHQQTLSVLAAALYYSAFEPNGAESEEDKRRIGVRIARATRVNLEKVYEILALAPPIITVDDFCKAIYQVTQNPRLDKFNTAVLYTMTNGNWFGHQHREIMAVALEYPPYWHALIFAAANERTYHGARLSKLVDRLNKQNAGKDFSSAVVKYLERENNE